MAVLTSGLGSRGCLVALSCAAACTAVAAGWHLRARRRATASRRAGCSSVHDALASAIGGEQSCDAPGLVTAFQVHLVLAGIRADRYLTDPTASRLSRTQQASPLNKQRTSRTSSGCSCMRYTSRPPWARAPRRRPRASTSLHTPSGAAACHRALLVSVAPLMLKRSKALLAAAR
jgi:hypothetical protein